MKTSFDIYGQIISQFRLQSRLTGKAYNICELYTVLYASQRYLGSSWYGIIYRLNSDMI